MRRAGSAGEEICSRRRWATVNSRDMVVSRSRPEGGGVTVFHVEKGEAKSGNEARRKGRGVTDVEAMSVRTPRVLELISKCFREKIDREESDERDTYGCSPRVGMMTRGEAVSKPGEERRRKRRRLDTKFSKLFFYDFVFVDLPGALMNGISATTRQRTKSGSKPTGGGIPICMAEEDAGTAGSVISNISAVDMVGGSTACSF